MWPPGPIQFVTWGGTCPGPRVPTSIKARQQIFPVKRGASAPQDGGANARAYPIASDNDVESALACHR